MKKQLGIALLVIVVFTMVGNSKGITKSATSAFFQDNIVTNEVVFSIPLGDKGIHYEGLDNPDMMIWGPPALSIAPDGSFWIADTPDDHLLRFSPKGELLDKIDARDFVIGAGDLEVTSTDIWVLDAASIPPKLVRLSLDGKVVSVYNLPKGLWLEDGLSGIALGSDGSIIIERIGGHALTQFISPSGETMQNALEGYEFQGTVYSAYPADMREKDASQGYIIAGEKQINVTVTNDLGGLSILHVNPDGSFYVKVVELMLNKSFQVDQKIYHYDASGNLLGMARVPLAEQYTPVEHGIVVGPDHEVYALITKPGGAEVQRLSFGKELMPVLIPPDKEAVDQQIEGSFLDAETCRDRESIIDVAKTYLNNSTDLTSYHINDNVACSDRVKPSYLGSAGTYSSVPYAWNLWDTIEQFNYFMS